MVNRQERKQASRLDVGASCASIVVHGVTLRENEPTRRDFLLQLSAGAGAAWLSANLPAILAAHDHAQRAAAASAKLEFFTAEQAKEVEAIAAQIIPTDRDPGAREAKAIYFIDRALITFAKGQQKDYTNGLAEVQDKLKELFPGVAKFSAATSAQQIAVLTALEKTPFFGTVRFHTIVGFTCDPSRGGNADKVGWQLMGFEDRYIWKPPFGYYDAEWLKQNKG